jgi:hypothetical protein
MGQAGGLDIFIYYNGTGLSPWFIYRNGTGPYYLLIIVRQDGGLCIFIIMGQVEGLDLQQRKIASPVEGINCRTYSQGEKLTAEIIEAYHCCQLYTKFFSYDIILSMLIPYADETIGDY